MNEELKRIRIEMDYINRLLEKQAKLSKTAWSAQTDTFNYIKFAANEIKLAAERLTKQVREEYHKAHEED